MNLLETIMGQLGPGTIGKLSGLLGENADKTKSALGAAVPALMGQVASKAGTEKGASELFDMIGDNDGSQDFSSMLDNKDSLMKSGSGMLSGLMGSQSSGLSSMLGKFTGMGGGSMTSLMGMIAPLIMGTLGKAKSTMGLDASGMAGLLSDQSESFKAAMPNGLADKMGSFGLGNVGGSIKGAAGNVVDGAGNLTSKAVDGVKGGVGAAGDAVGNVGRGAANVASDIGRGTANVAGDVADAGGGLFRKLGPLLGLLLLGALGFFGWQMCGSDVKNTAGNAVDATKNVADKAADATKNAASKTLDATKNAAGAVGDAAGKAADATKNAAGKAVEGVKDGAKAVGNAASNTVKKGAEALGFAAGSVEAGFADLLSSGKAKVGSKIALNNVKFATGSANLERSSYVQLNNLIKIMEAYPNLKVKLEGHTDNTGDAAKNVTLSDARANAAMNYVVSKGVAKNRLQANGIGGAKPVASNATTDGRRQNRRVEASILSL